MAISTDREVVSFGLMTCNARVPKLQYYSARAVHGAHTTVVIQRTFPFRVPIQVNRIYFLLFCYAASKSTLLLNDIALHAAVTANDPGSMVDNSLTFNEHIVKIVA